VFVLSRSGGEGGVFLLWLLCQVAGAPNGGGSLVLGTPVAWGQRQVAEEAKEGHSTPLVGFMTSK
jgi:hypothetical protein